MKSISQLLLIVMISLSCKHSETTGQVMKGRILPGAERPVLYMPKLQEMNVALVVNQSSRRGQQHLVDFLSQEGIQVMKIFTPEHGFRGEADAGEKIKDERDPVSGLPIISLYGKNKKPQSSDLTGLDLIVFDIQDVGVRFYTYISTLHYVMEAAAENNIKVIVLDRPNPLSSYVDGPILEMEHSSFVGMHPVPVVYGMTIGEYAQMINGEGWLNNEVKCELEVIPISNYTHQDKYLLPIKPSPNLPNAVSIGHYPALCFFEGTTVSVGRGTGFPFQTYGHPAIGKSEFSFTPKSGPGAKYPKHENALCHGRDLRKVKPEDTKLDLSHLIDAYEMLSAKREKFFNDDNFFTLLAGTKKLRKQLEDKVHLDEIRASWAPGLLEFEIKRKQYLIYD